jgi:hypothetical protein
MLMVLLRIMTVVIIDGVTTDSTSPAVWRYRC